MGKDTVYRVEERKHPHQSHLDFINDVFNPVEKVEKLISEFREEQKQLAYAIEEKLMTVWKKEEKDKKEKEKGALRKNTATVDLDNLLSLFHIDFISTKDLYVEVNEQEIKSLEAPNSSDFDSEVHGLDGCFTMGVTCLDSIFVSICLHISHPEALPPACLCKILT
jgi:argonaute-like protein implicated in RNA metabolism and viral defense